MKKTLSITLALILILCTVSVFPVSASTKEPHRIYFQFPEDGRWGNPENVEVGGKRFLSNVYCHIYKYSVEGEGFSTEFMSRSSQCVSEGNNIYSFTFPEYAVISPGAQYKVSFLTAANRELAPKTYGWLGTAYCFFTADDMGKLAVLTDEYTKPWDGFYMETYPQGYYFEWQDFNSEMTGDAVIDGKLDIKDVTAVQKYAARLNDFTERQKGVSDFNGDGKVDISDATLIQLKIANK